MWERILDLAIKNGLWAVLFLGLFVFVLKDSHQRENKYQQTIKDLTDHLGVVNDIKAEVEQVKQIVFKKSKKTKNLAKGETNEKQVEKL